MNQAATNRVPDQMTNKNKQFLANVLLCFCKSSNQILVFSLNILSTYKQNRKSLRSLNFEVTYLPIQQNMGAEHSHDVERRRDYEKEEIKLRNVIEKCAQGKIISHQLLF